MSGAGSPRRRTIFLAVSAIVVTAVILASHAVLHPFLFALVVAYVLTPAVCRVEKQARLPRWAAILVVYALTLGSIGGFVGLIVPRLVSEGQSLAAEGRRAVAEGKRPPIKDAIGKIMGSKTMSIDDIFEGLKAKSWLPNSSEPRQYISYLLSTSKDRFERVASAGRGFYRAKSADTKVEPAPKADPAPKAEVAPKADNHVPSTDEILANAGVLGNAVFGG